MKKLIYFLLVGIVFWGVGCGNLSVQPDLEKVSLQLKWLHQSQFAGNYTAQAKGYYQREGLDVSFYPFEKGVDVGELIDSGKKDFGIMGADELLLARQKGQKIKAVAVIYKINPVCAYSLKEKGIVKPEDLVGKIVGLEPSDNVRMIYEAGLGSQGIDRQKISEVTIGYVADELLSGKVDVATGYIVNEPLFVEESGQDVNIILFADYGVNVYADVLVVSEKNIRERPEFVQKFIKASLDGWRFAVTNQREAVDYVMKYASNTNRRHQEKMLQQSVPLIYTGKSPIGWMDEKEWANVWQVLVDYRGMNPAVKYQDAFTDVFLKKIYNL